MKVLEKGSKKGVWRKKVECSGKKMKSKMHKIMLYLAVQNLR